MPGGDKTGPMGRGAMTGRGAGYCSGNDRPGYATMAMGWGPGMGFGRGGGFGGGGRGWRNRYFATGLPGWMRSGRYAGRTDFSVPYPRATAVNERAALQSEAEALQAELDAIQQRLAALDTEGGDK